LNATVIQVKVGFRPGFPEVSERNRLFSSLTKNPDYAKMLNTELLNLHPALAARPEEPVVAKSCISAFEGTDLKVLLRSKDIDTLVLFGIITSGVVLSTALEAMDQDYRVLIVRDACADSDPELHACLLDRLLAKADGCYHDGPSRSVDSGTITLCTLPTRRSTRQARLAGRDCARYRQF
jgi:nicotinamidase-related amidase